MTTRRPIWLMSLVMLCVLAAPVRAAIPETVTVLRNIAYGPAKLQAMDVYLPPQPRAAPIILMVHGGAWAIGDKANPQVYENKVARWVPLGFIVISANYPMVPESDPAGQADDIARALAKAQNAAPGWGGDPDRFILMGHSAGAHLITLLNADPTHAYEQGARPWLGAISLDSGALDVPAIMERRHPKLYDRAPGNDPAFWRDTSPIHHLTRDSPPWLGVCSSLRRGSCGANETYAAAARRLGVRAGIMGRKLDHGEINGELGKPGAYTDAVEAFMASLDPAVKGLLTR